MANFQDFMMKQLQQERLQKKLENIFTSSRVPGTYLRNPEPSRAGKLTDMLTSGLESLGVGGQAAYNIGNTVQSLTPAKSLDDLDKGDPTSALESIAGGPAQAMFVGPMARGIDQLALKEARGLARAGTAPSSILKDTGWFRGRDEKWRTEIDDSVSRIHGNRSMGMGADDVGVAGLSTDMRNPDIMNDVFTHAKLYEAYPELAEYGVNELDPALAAQGYGGSFGRTNRKLAATVDGGLPSHNITMASGAFGAAPGKGPRNTMLHELQHAVQGIEGFEGGASPDWVKEMAAQGTISQEAFKPFWRRAIEERGYSPKVAMDKAFHDVYERNAGEAEARLVENRSNMTPGTRRRIDPTTMFDVPFDEQWLWNRDINDMLKGGRGVSSKGWTPQIEAPVASKNWQEMYHGTATPNLFDKPAADMRDAGLSLSRDPSVASAFAAGITRIPDKNNNASRIYPMLVDPGNTYKGFNKNWGVDDPSDWVDPAAMASSLEYGPRKDKVTKQLIDDMKSGMAPKEAFTGKGFDSVDFNVPDYWGLDEDNPYRHGMMLFDDQRAIPKFSNQGLSITSAGNYKPAIKRLPKADVTVWEDAIRKLGLR